MNSAIPGEVIAAFTSMPVEDFEKNDSPLKIIRIGHGLINHTFRISGLPGIDLLVQNINKNVFANPEQVQENYLRIWKYSITKKNGLFITTPKFYKKNISLFIDSDNNYWRAFKFIENSLTIENAVTTDQASTTAICFANFVSCFEDFDASLLHETIPRFHDLGYRFTQFEQSVSVSKFRDRKVKAAELVAALGERKRYLLFYEKLIQSGGLLKRVMHLDAKISNILFHEKSGEIICPIDLDTMMPGYIFSDVGDMIRSMSAACDENENEPDKIQIRKEFYDAIVSGYLGVMGSKMTAIENQNIHFAGLMMFYMQALRFMTDYLNGDTYYQVKYPEHNFDRALNQLTQLKQLEKLLEADYRFTI